MKEIKSHKDLLIWQKGIEITVSVYQLVESFPKDEIYALSNQIKRAAVSVPSNIAEGYGRNSNKSFHHFLSISRGSLFELETQLRIAEKLNFIENKNLFDQTQKLIEEESKMINAFSKSLIH
jgi:four helix bundle protein